MAASVQLFEDTRPCAGDLIQGDSGRFLNPIDWIRTLPPQSRSCIKLGSIEPCVNKAVVQLGRLKQQLDEDNGRLVQLASVAKADRTCDRFKQAPESITPKSILVHKEPGATSSTDSGRSSRLIIEGVATGTSKYKLSNFPTIKSMGVSGLYDDGVINNAIRLVARLEQDRQDTLNSLAKEKVKVQSLSESLNRECERRLDLLPTIVQAEHDKCLHNILKLKWHIKVGRKQLNNAKNTFRPTMLVNDNLRQFVSYYKENCPLLKEKLEVESGHMSTISHCQQQTSDKVVQAKHLLSQAEEKSTRVHDQTREERKNMENILDEHRLELANAEEEFEKVDSHAANLAQQITDCHEKISNQIKQSQNLDDELSLSKDYQSKIESRMSVVHDHNTAMEANHFKLNEKLNQLKELKQSEIDRLEAEYSILLAALEQEDDSLMRTRDYNENLEHEIDTLKEMIATSTKQAQSNEKTVERRRRELINLDEQIGVIGIQFTEANEENSYLSDQLKMTEAKAGHLENSLKTQLGVLKIRIKEETSSKKVHNEKIKTGSAAFEMIKMEHNNHTDVNEKLAQENESTCEKQIDMVAKLEEDRKEKSSLLTSLQSQLSSLESEYTMVEKDLSEKIESLTLQLKELSELMQVKISRVDSVSERISLLQRNIEDLVKSTAMIEKMEVTTRATVEQLDTQLIALRENLASEKEEEQKSKQEYKDIDEFSSMADKNHTSYVEKRTELLQQWETDLHNAHSTNSKLAADYKKLQSEFISAKSLAIRVVEKKLNMEASLRDQKQLLAFQSCIYSAMKASYEHRGNEYWREITHFYKQSKHNMVQLRLLQDQFRTVIKLTHEFLEHELPSS